jgi:crossover junction endodeoxyribonuclease RuvC
VDEEGGGMTMVACGVLSQPSKVPVERRLSFLYKELVEIVARYKPDEVAIEEPFVAGNARSALAIGRAQAIAILAAANENLPIFRYLPTQVKQQVTTYGGSEKEQVQEMVRLQLGLAQPPQSSDAADALAVAICHLHQRHIERLLARGK